MIEAVALAKRYGNVEAVRGVSFSAGGAQVLGLLGPNGAGKTTILRMLAGFHFPSAGEARIDGFSIVDDGEEAKRRVGYLPENARLYGDLSVDEYLSFIAEARGMEKKARKERIDFVLDDCGLLSVRSRLIGNLSRGYRQRVGLAQAILHDPPCLILDEPTTGLDPNQIVEIRDLIRRLGESKTVILSTHILQEAESLCSRVIILNEGLVAAQGSPAEIAATLRGVDSWEVVLKGDPVKAAGEASAIRGLASVPEVVSLKGDAFLLRVSFGSSAAEYEGGERIFDWAVPSGFKVLSMTRNRMSLEDIFEKLTQEGRNDED